MSGSISCFMLWSSGTKGRSVAGMGVPLKSGNSVPSVNIGVGWSVLLWRERGVSVPNFKRSPIPLSILHQRYCPQAHLLLSVRFPRIHLQLWHGVVFRILCNEGKFLQIGGGGNHRIRCTELPSLLP